MLRRARSRPAWILAAFVPLCCAVGCRAVLGIQDYGDDQVTDGAASSNDGYSGSDSEELLPDGGTCIPDPPDPRYFSDATQVVAGFGFSCALRASGEVACWGDNSKGQLGVGGVAFSATPMTIGAFRNAKQIAAGESHACAVLATGDIYCWGANDSGQLGRSGASSPAPVVAQHSPLFYAVAAGGAHTCALAANSAEALCWGENREGELNVAASDGGPIPRLVAGSSVSEADAALALGNTHVCLLANGVVDCWGGNTQGQLGVSGTDAATATLGAAFTNQHGITGIRGGGNDTCVLTATGIFCAGANSNLQLGGTAAPGPSVLSALSGAVDIAICNSHSCMWNQSGQLFCVGENGQGQLGNGAVDSGGTFGAIAVAGIDAGTVFGPVLGAAVAGEFSPISRLGTSIPRHSCAILAANCGNYGTVYCWGSNQLGEVGDGVVGSNLGTDSGTVLTPTPVVAP